MSNNGTPVGLPGYTLGKEGPLAPFPAEAQEGGKAWTGGERRQGGE